MLYDFFEKFKILDRVTTADGFGGVTEKYTDGAQIMAGISTNNSTEAQIAYQSGVKVMYTIVTKSTVNLKPNDVLKRVKDNSCYRVTSYSADMTTPSVSVMKFSQVNAEAIKV